MGYDRHHALLISTRHADDLLAEGQALANRLFDGLAAVTPIAAGGVNHVWTFAVFPDGSKEGWEHSERGDKARTELIRWLNEQRHEDGSSPFQWAEVQYGDDNDVTIVTRHSDEPQYNDIIA